MENLYEIPCENPLVNSVTILSASLNEVENIDIWINQILELRQKLFLTPIKEIVIVDDGSSDGTQDKILSLAKTAPIKIKLIQRNAKMGTLNAQITGAINSKSEYLLVMDCDLQHSVSFIPNFIRELEKKPDIIIGSRYIKGGLNEWSPYRGIVSRTATFFSHILLKNSRKAHDPLSGYFVIRKEFLSCLKPYTGMYKPLLFAITSFSTANIIEIPIVMESRNEGESKIMGNPIKVILRYMREILVFWKSAKKVNVS